jgi:hypothetical protein
MGQLVVDQRTHTPSYSYKSEEVRRLDALNRGFGLEHPVWAINDKDGARTWAEGLGLRQPRLLATFASPADVPWAQLPDRLVLKPVQGSGSRGVHLLQRDGEAWFELRTQRRLTSGQVQELLLEKVRQGKISAALVAEELVDDPRRPGLPPVDWKVVTFFGRIGLVQAKAVRLDARGRPVSGWRYFDEQWNDLGRAKAWREADPTIEPPVHAEQVLATARRISAAVPRAMLRVDLYDDVDGVVFGEVTPEPGGLQKFRRDLDSHLGALWEEAEARLQVRAAAAQVLTPATAALPESAAVLVGPGPE